MQNQNSGKNAKDVESYYDDYTLRQKRYGVNKRHHSILEKLVSAGLKSEDHVLEIGCGIGTFTSLLVKKMGNGKLTSLDISSKSIEEAKLLLPGYSMLELIHADVLVHDFNGKKFDVIVLPDVLEHIPIELHGALFEKLSSLLNINGFIFIHMPNPYFQDWCHVNAPHLLQIIDQAVHTDVVVRNAYPHGLYIDELKTYTIWVKEGDYQYIVLKKIRPQDFSKLIVEKVSFWAKLKFKLNGLFK